MKRKSAAIHVRLLTTIVLLCTLAGQQAHPAELKDGGSDPRVELSREQFRARMKREQEMLWADRGIIRGPSFTLTEPFASSDRFRLSQKRIPDWIIKNYPRALDFLQEAQEPGGPLVEIITATEPGSSKFDTTAESGELWVPLGDDNHHPTKIGAYALPISALPISNRIAQRVVIVDAIPRGDDEFRAVFGSSQNVVDTSTIADLDRTLSKFISQGPNVKSQNDQGDWKPSIIRDQGKLDELMKSLVYPQGAPIILFIGHNEKGHFWTQDGKSNDIADISNKCAFTAFCIFISCESWGLVVPNAVGLQQPITMGHAVTLLKDILGVIEDTKWTTDPKERFAEDQAGMIQKILSLTYKADQPRVIGFRIGNVIIAFLMMVTDEKICAVRAISYRCYEMRIPLN